MGLEKLGVGGLAFRNLWEIRVRGSGLSCPVWRSYSRGEFRSIIGSSINWDLGILD